MAAETAQHSREEGSQKGTLRCTSACIGQGCCGACCFCLCSGATLMLSKRFCIGTHSTTFTAWPLCVLLAPLLPSARWQSGHTEYLPDHIWLQILHTCDTPDCLVAIRLGNIECGSFCLCGVDGVSVVWPKEFFLQYIKLGSVKETLATKFGIHVGG